MFGKFGQFLLVEQFWAAHERTAPKIESQEAVCIPRNADPNAPPDFYRLVVTVSEPQRALLAKIEPIEPAINPQRGGEPSWPSRQIAHALDAAILPHDRDAFERLESPDQDAGSDPGFLA